MNHVVHRERPVRPGSSIGVIGGAAGTATVLVRRADVKDGAAYLLGCEHVLKPKNIRAGSKIVQPAVQDGVGTGFHNQIGEQVITAGLSEAETNLVDAAIVRLNTAIKPHNLTTEGAWPIIAIDTNVYEDMAVTMIGRSSGEVFGKVEDAAAQSSFDYSDLGWKKKLQFSQIAKCQYECDSGDSGAPVINSMNGKLVGLHIAGGEEGGVHYGFFCPISRVFDALKIELI